MSVESDRVEKDDVRTSEKQQRRAPGQSIMPSPVDLRGVARAAAAESAERFHAAGAAIQQHAAKRQQHAASSGLHLAHRISQLCSARLVAVSKRGPCFSARCWCALGSELF